MKTLAVLFSAVAAIAVALTLPAVAQTPTPDPSTGTVNATISTELVAIELSQATVNYGVLDAGMTNQVPSPAVFDVTNIGSVPVDLAVRGANTSPPSSGTPWTLGSTPGMDQYVHEAAPGSGFSPSVLLTTLAQPIHENVLVGTATAASIFLRLDMPTEITSFGVHTAPVIVTATKHIP